jgi:phytoene dehydrogenase-like protein
MEKYDVIVVGAGLAGLSTGAILTKAGKKVLILEKNKDVGGFARTHRPFPGYYIDEGVHGFHLSSKSAIAEVYQRVGKTLPKFSPTPPSDLSMISNNPNEVARILDLITNMSDEEIEELEDVSLKDYITRLTQDPGILNLFQIIGPVLCSIRTWEDASAGEVVNCIKASLERFPGEVFNCPTILGGYGNLLPPLVEAIAENGGEIRTETMVAEIIVEDGKAKGVEVEKGFRTEKGYVSWGVERIESPIVVATIPLWDLFRVVREDVFPSWYVAWVKRICENLNQCWTIFAGLKQPLWEPPNLTMGWPNMPRTKSTHGGCVAYHWSVFDPSAAPEGEYLFYWLLHSNSLECPYLLEPEKAENRRRIIDVFERMEADLIELFPKFKDALWVIRHAQNMYIAKQPGYVGKHMPDVQPPGVEGLYLAGDKIRARGAGVGGNLAAITAMKCANLILGSRP